MTAVNGEVKTARPPKAGCWIAIPWLIAARQDLTPGQKLIFGCIYSLSKCASQRCFISNKGLSDRTGLELRCVRRALTRLESDGLIKRVMDNQHHREEIKVLWDQPIEPPASYPEYLASEHWQQVREDAVRRADGRCQFCNTSGQLDVHHRTYQRLGSEKPTDVLALCRKCHELFHEHRKVVR